MGKNPADQFYWQDFYRDLHEHPLEVVGAWILILCKLWYEPERGKGFKTLDEWAKILGKNRKISLKILLKIQQKNIGNVNPKLEKCIKNMPKDLVIEVTSRRMVEREKRRQYDRLYNKQYYEKGKKKYDKTVNSRQIQEIIQDKIPNASSYLLTSNIKSDPNGSPSVTKKDENPYEKQIEDLRDKLGKAYWRRSNDNVHKWVMFQLKKNLKAQAILYCLMRIDKERPENPWAYAESILKTYNDSELYKKDNLFKDIVEKMKRL